MERVRAAAPGRGRARAWDDRRASSGRCGWPALAELLKAVVAGERYGADELPVPEAWERKALRVRRANRRGGSYAQGNLWVADQAKPNGAHGTVAALRIDAACARHSQSS